MMRKTFILFCLIGVINGLSAQSPFEPPEDTEIDKWDTWIAAGNKIVFGGHSYWKLSTELQFRANDNAQSLDRWFIETVATFSINEHWEIVPDYRFSVTSKEVEHRPGLGAIYKHNIGKLREDSKLPKQQLAHQIKWQADLDSESQYGLRYMLTYSNFLKDNLVFSALAGIFYRWSDDFNGVQFIRVGPGLTYVFNPQHTLAVVYALGFENRGELWTYSNFPLIQLIIRVRKDYKYVPAKYINF